MKWHRLRLRGYNLLVNLIRKISHHLYALHFSFSFRFFFSLLSQHFCAELEVPEQLQWNAWVFKNSFIRVEAIEINDVHEKGEWNMYIFQSLWSIVLRFARFEKCQHEKNIHFDWVILNFSGSSRVYGKKIKLLSIKHLRYWIFISCFDLIELMVKTLKIHQNLFHTFFGKENEQFDKRYKLMRNTSNFIIF